MLGFMPSVPGKYISRDHRLETLDHENAFTESDRRLLTTLANSMSVAIENARLFDETQRLSRRRKKRERRASHHQQRAGRIGQKLDFQRHRGTDWGKK